MFELIQFFTKDERIEKFFLENKIKISLKGNIEEIRKLEKKVSKDKQDFITKLDTWHKELNEKIKKEKFKVNIALNYDGQEEIVHSVNQILEKINSGELKQKNINTKTIKENLWFNQSKAPEIIVRPGNAPRLSGFMLWDSEYSEIYLTNKLWPELNETDFIAILDWYKKLKRNFGK